MSERILKFRAWHKEKNRIFTVDYLQWSEKDPQYQVGTLEDDDSYSFADVVLMQYTGLKDKQGKEIWEGDIVKVPESGGSFSNIEVRWQKVAGSDDMGTDMIGFASYEGCEVIGNLYENPELLHG